MSIQEPTFTKREAAILYEFQVARSLQEVADRLDTSYMVIWREVDALRTKGFIRELPFPRDGHKVFQTMWSNVDGENETLNFALRGVAASLSEFAPRFVQDNANVNMLGKQIGGIITHLWIRSWMRDNNQAGFMPDPSPSKARRNLLDVREYLRELNEFVDAMLLSPLWDDAAMVHRLIGELDLGDAQEIAAEWEHFYIEKYEK